VSFAVSNVELAVITVPSGFVKIAVMAVVHPLGGVVHGRDVASPVEFIVATSGSLAIQVTRSVMS